MTHLTLASLADYAELRRSYQVSTPEYFNFGTDVVDGWAASHPDLTALWWVGADDEDRRLSFAQFSRRSNRVAHALRRAGLNRGDRVLVCLPSVPEWWEVMVGLTKADLIAVPATTMLTEADIAFRLEAAGIDAVVTDESGADKIGRLESRPEMRLQLQVGGALRTGWTPYESALADSDTASPALRTRSDGPALIYFTSGTTGPPKMVLHSHASYGIGHRLTADFWLRLEPGEVHWNLSDTGWAKTAYAGLFGPWIQGATVFVVHRPGKFQPSEVPSILSRYPVESLCAPPTVYRMLVQETLDTETWVLRQARAAGEALNVEVLRKWQDATGVLIREGYGQTETVLLCGSLGDLPVRPGSMGLPPPGIDVAVIDDTGAVVPPGEPGEIAVRTQPHVPVGLFKGYWQNPGATDSCFRHGWYHTGDNAYVDDDGYFWFVARGDDIITSSAYRIGPFEVENALMEHPAVAEVAVVGKPDPERTEIVKAFVVLARGFKPGEALKVELQEHSKAATAPYKYPREIEFLDELPKTITGKIRRNELRARP